MLATVVAEEGRPAGTSTLCQKEGWATKECLLGGKMLRVRHYYDNFPLSLFFVLSFSSSFIAMTIQDLYSVQF